MRRSSTEAVLQNAIKLVTSMERSLFQVIQNPKLKLDEIETKKLQCLRTFIAQIGSLWNIAMVQEYALLLEMYTKDFMPTLHNS
ncbi:hypothetical protein RIF29_27804 [Crotalaria pallida]|uniref:Uncharacterized protein n=1 Tax=Crotalaria pallida TaxID=3830 RepID=A0AAN9I5Y5_CROPI